MNEAQLQAFLNLAMLCLLLAAIALMWAVKHGGLEGRLAARLREAVSRGAQAQADDPALALDRHGAARWLRRLARFGERLPLFDAAYRRRLQAEMTRGGYRSQRAAEVLIAIKFFCGLVCAIGAVSFGTHLPLGQYPVFRGLGMLASFFVGMLVPELLMKWRAGRRRAAMAQCLPDALDLLVICTNAGNSLGVSIRRVGVELAPICPALAEEFALAADELAVSGDSHRALTGLAERIDLPSIRALISTLTQSMRYGTPITQALRTLSRTERVAHIVSLEERAAKLAPKMVLPMMLFILPPVVVIAAGPAVIQLLDSIAAR
jgi:tight adherence protein C